MKLVIFTICLNGEPFIERHLAVFEQLKSDWQWVVVEGAAANTHCTAWCREQSPGLSTDGTSEYLNSIIKHPRVKVFRRQLWDGKVSMCNRAIQDITDPRVLLQCDVDEFFTAEQIDKIVQIFESQPEIYRMYFFCRYWLGKNIVAKGENCYSNRRGEWLRAFRFMPGMKFERHEPPVLANNSKGLSLGRDATRGLGLVFDHFSWVDEKTVMAKLKFYGYGERNIEGWRRLQANKQWPVRLKQYLPWVDAGSTADKVKI